MREDFKMTFTLLDIIRSLAGPINPVGETNEDEKRYNSLIEVTAVVNLLIKEITWTAGEKDRPEYSRSRAGKTATRFLDDLRKELENFLGDA